MTDEEYLGNLRAQLAENIQRIASLRSELAAEEDRHRKLTSAIAAVEQLATLPLGQPATSTGPTGPTGPRLVGSITGVAARAGVGSVTVHSGPRNLPEAAEAVLREAEKPMHFRDLIPRIQALGVESGKTYEQIRATLASTLDRKVARGDVFAKVGPSTYALRAWDESGERGA